ncbi:peptidoglycan-binding domain-containing protein [Streptomyces sp. NPDC046881]|uniref:peptidoglycan-binding domain-containing protein n=1 Tax=Streptomyces sp. NPDC046881 TaxID=3155374 RepID=UPI0033F44FE2
MGKPPEVRGPSPKTPAPAAAPPDPLAAAPSPGSAPPDPLAAAPSRGSAPPDRAPGRKPGHARRRFTSLRDLLVAGILGLGAASGLVLATWLLIHHDAGAAASPSPSGYGTAPPPARRAPQDPPGETDRPRPGVSDPPLPEIPGTGVLRPGDSGHGVFELQVRLQQLPGIYDGGAIDGRYDAEVRAAVTRFQQRYGVGGDESGVYGAQTRFALMLRTK